MSRTYENVGAALADPTSNLSRQLVKARETTRTNDKVIAAWMAKGFTHEQAWSMALYGRLATD